MLELLEATAPASPIARFLEKRGPGLHHVALAVDDIHAALAELRAAGVRLIDDDAAARAPKARSWPSCIRRRPQACSSS